MKNEKLSIIILSFNTKDFLEICINSIYRYLPENFSEVIVVDNASKDESGAMAKKHFPKIKLIISDVNLGFAKGCNLGVRQARGEYLLFLNSDARLQNGNIVNMLSFMENDEKVGIVGGMLFNNDGTMQRSFGKFYNLWNVILMLIGGDALEMKLSGSEYQGKPIFQRGAAKVDWVSGGFMMVRRSVFEKLRGFDEHFFMYIEDMEFCYRARKIGLTSFIFPKVSATHASHGSSTRSFAVGNIYKGLLYYYKKHKSQLEYIILKAMLLIKAWVLVVLGAITGNEYLRDTYKKAVDGMTNS